MSNVNLERIGWQNGTLVSKAKVEIDGVIYEVEPEEYTGSTPLSAENLIKMENNIEYAINAVAPDTGWQDLTLAQDITAQSSAAVYKPQYRKIGKIVYVEGCVKGATSNNQTLATLPTGYRPSHQMRYITGRSGTAHVVLQLSTTGEITFICMSDNSEVSASTYIYIQASFVTD